MSPRSVSALAERVARQLGLDPVSVAGTGPDGARTLADVLREAGRETPAAARPPPPRPVFDPPGVNGPDVRRVEATCDAMPIEDTRDALAGVCMERPDAFDVVVRLCGVALRDFPTLTGTATGGRDPSEEGSVDVLAAGPVGAGWVQGADRAGIEAIREATRSCPSASRAGSPEGERRSAAAFVIRTADSRDARPRGASAGSDLACGAVLTVAERSGTIVLDLETRTVAEEDGVGFLARLGELCRDPRRALL